MRGLALQPIALLIPTYGLAASTGQPIRAFLVALPLAWACVWRARWALSPPAQILVALGLGGVTLLLYAVGPPPEVEAGLALDPLWAQVGLWSLMVAALRLQLDRPVFGQTATLGLGLVTFLALGTVNPFLSPMGGQYPFLLAAFAALSFLAVHGQEVEVGGRPPFRVKITRNGVVGSAVVFTAAVLTVVLVVSVPVYLVTMVREGAWKLAQDRRQTGFHDGPITLHTLDRLLDSDSVVMRVQGDVGERLRGNVYTHYMGGRWYPTPRPQRRRVRTDWAEASAEPGGGIRAVIRYAQSGSNRYFMPIVGGRLALAPADAQIDEVGVVQPEHREEVERVVVSEKGLSPLWGLRPGPGSRTDFIRPPRPSEQAVPEELEPLLLGIASGWTKVDQTPIERVESIRKGLEKEYVYSLVVQEGSGSESRRAALVRFLTETRQGHCEYFATAMALLARVSGVPARLVTGYRVAERNPFGDYSVVRDRHAHAWAEVYLENEGWVTVDPTPLRSLEPDQAVLTPWLEGLFDWGVFGLRRYGLEVLLTVLVAGLAIVQLRRLFRLRAGRVASSSPTFSEPPDWMKDLLNALAARGIVRTDSESLESLIRRLSDQFDHSSDSDPDLREAALLLSRYSALRYGDEGHEPSIRSEFERWMRGSTA